jgi:ABC-type lipoprotein export system ATPase subunit
MNEDLVIDARGLYHIYRGRELETVALRGADLALEPGSWTSVMGPSGSGKSTLLHVMAGLLEPSGGAVMIGADDITRLPAPERAQRRRRLIGVVLQRDNLHPLLDAAGNVALPLRIDGRPRAEVGARVDALLADVGLGDRRQSLPGQLSGGEAQRVAVAVALASRPRVLLADEPTGNLDSRNGEAVMELLHDLHNSGSTIIMVTHDARFARNAQRTVHLFDGRVVSEAVEAA